MSELDSFFGDLLQDNFSTGDDFGSDFNTLDSLFSDSDASFANFDGLANDPILGNAVAKKEKMVPVATTVAPSTSSPVHAKLERPDIAAPLPTATAQFNLNQAPTTMLPVTTPIQWTPQVTPTTPFVFGQAASPTAATPLAGGNAALMPATLQANQFAYHRPLQPSLAPVPNKQFRRLVDLKEREEEDKKEKKRLAVRKCREKKRKEMKELESRAGTFDEEIKELRQQLKRARTEGMPTENPAKNLENVQALMSALRNSDNRALDAVTSKLVAHDCTATTPCSSAEAFFGVTSTCLSRVIRAQIKWQSLVSGQCHFILYLCMIQNTHGLRRVSFWPRHEHE